MASELLFLFIILASTASPSRAQQATTWLVPISRNGPNNQKRDFRNVLAMAKKLETGYVLTGLYKHYRERLRRFKMDVTVENAPNQTCFAEDTPVWGYMDFDRVIDRRPIQEWIPTASVAELKQQGWDGQLDAILYPEGKEIWEDNYGYVNRTLTAEGLTLRQGAAHILTPALLRCKPDIMSDIKAALQQYKYVGVMLTTITHHVVPNLLHEPKAKPSASCARAVFEANRVVQTAPWVKEVARKYISETLKNEKFMAVQIRPYPDTCADEWRRVGNMQVIKPGAIRSTACIREHRDLHFRLGRCIFDMMQSRGLTRLFVMAHPAIQPTIAAILERARLQRLQEDKEDEPKDAADVVEIEKKKKARKLFTPEAGGAGIRHMEQMNGQSQVMKQEQQQVYDAAAQTTASVGIGASQAPTTVPEGGFTVGSYQQANNLTASQSSTYTIAGAQDTISTGNAMRSAAPSTVNPSTNMISTTSTALGVAGETLAGHVTGKQGVAVEAAGEQQEAEPFFNYLKLSDVGPLAGCADTSPTFLSMVEESIAVEADFFLGSSASSITHSIAYQRMGMSRQDNMYLEKMEC